MKTGYGPDSTLVCFAIGASILLSGCIEGDKPISTSSRSPLKSEFALTSEKVLDSRYLLIAVRVDSSEFEAADSYGSFSFSPSAWSGLGFFPEYGISQTLNLHVIDLQKGTDHVIFERQVALYVWDTPAPSDPERLRFADTLLLRARAADTNNDKVIDSKDQSVCYVYRLSENRLERLTPEGYSVERAEFAGDQIAFVLWDHSNGEYCIYKADPLTLKGSFVVKGLKLDSGQP